MSTPNPETTKQPTQGSPASAYDLGGGVRTTLNGSDQRVRQPAGDKCHAGDYDDWKPIDDIRTTAFYGYRKSYVERKVDAALNVSTNFGIGASVDSKILNNYDQETTQRNLFVLIKVKTKSREYEKIKEDHDYGICQAGTPKENATEFVNDCGQEYVDKQIYGGYVIMSMDLSGITTNQLKEVTVNAEATTPGTTIGVNTLFTNLRQMTSITANFDVQSLGGVPLPKGNFSDGITEDEWQNYYDALEEWEGGNVIENSYQKYSAQNYRNCVRNFEDESDFSSALSCYTTMSRAVRKLDRTSQKINRLADRVQ